MNKILPYLERLFLATILMGVILKFLEIGTQILIATGLSGLTLVFFLNLKNPLNIPVTDDEKLGFNEFFSWLIIPNMLWISTALGTLGILFYFLELGNNGYLQLLYVASLTKAIASLFLVIQWLKGTKHLNVVLQIYFRTLPVLLLAIYIIFH